MQQRSGKAFITPADVHGMYSASNKTSATLYLPKDLRIQQLIERTPHMLQQESILLCDCVGNSTLKVRDQYLSIPYPM